MEKDPNLMAEQVISSIKVDGESLSHELKKELTTIFADALSNKRTPLSSGIIKLTMGNDHPQAHSQEFVDAMSKTIKESFGDEAKAKFDEMINVASLYTIDT